MIKTMREPELRDALNITLANLHKYPDDINLRNQLRALEEEIAYVQHFGQSRKRRGYR